MTDNLSSIELFKARIELGLKAYYKSSPEHIRIDSYSEMNMATKSKDHYLVMYDTIPGGTGYLSKLYNPEAFTTLLKYAYDRIHECTCQYEGKDGCYHCILTYGNQYKREEFSRELAETLFEKLMTHADAWEMLSGTVGSISASGVVEDSELELKFVDALRRVAHNEHWEFAKIADVNSYRYELRILEKETDIKYYIIPQFALGGPYGVRRYTVADFLIVCMSAKIDGQGIEDLNQLPMWGVFLDGYNYHAKAPNLRFYDDLEKRESIRASVTHRLYSWTMTWEDIKLFEQDREDWLGLDSVRRLVALLKNPQLGYLRETVLDWLLTAAENGKPLNKGKELFKAEINIDESAYDVLTEESSDEVVASALEHSIAYDWQLNRDLKDIDCEEWTEFWRMYDLLQFFPNAQHKGGTAANNASVDREEIKMYYPGLEDIVDALLDHDIPFSYEGDVDLLNEEGIVIASAQMILTEQKMVIDPVDEASKKVFADGGYKVITAADFSIDNIKHS